MFIVTRIPIRSCPRRWFAAWFWILDNLISILTLEFLYSSFGPWWYLGTFEIRMAVPLRFWKRVRWWLNEFEMVLWELVTVVTLGRLVITRL